MASLCTAGLTWLRRNRATAEATWGLTFAWVHLWPGLAASNCPTLPQRRMQSKKSWKNSKKREEWERHFWRPDERAATRGLTRILSRIESWSVLEKTSGLRARSRTHWVTRARERHAIRIEWPNQYAYAHVWFIRDLQSIWGRAHRWFCQRKWLRWRRKSKKCLDLSMNRRLWR